MSVRHFASDEAGGGRRYVRPSFRVGRSRRLSRGLRSLDCGCVRGIGAEIGMDPRKPRIETPAERESVRVRGFASDGAGGGRRYVRPSLRVGRSRRLSRGLRSLDCGCVRGIGAEIGMDPRKPRIETPAERESGSVRGFDTVGALPRSSAERGVRPAPPYSTAGRQPRLSVNPCASGVSIRSARCRVRPQNEGSAPRRPTQPPDGNPG